MKNVFNIVELFVIHAQSSNYTPAQQYIDLAVRYGYTEDQATDLLFKRQTGYFTKQENTEEHKNLKTFLVG